MLTYQPRVRVVADSILCTGKEIQLFCIPSPLYPEPREFEGNSEKSVQKWNISAKSTRIPQPLPNVNVWKATAKCDSIWRIISRKMNTKYAYDKTNCGYTNNKDSTRLHISEQKPSCSFIFRHLFSRLWISATSTLRLNRFSHGSFFLLKRNYQEPSSPKHPAKNDNTLR